MVNFVAPTPAPMNAAEIMDLADTCRQASGHVPGRTARELIQRIGGIIDAPDIEAAIGTYVLVEGPNQRFFVRSATSLSIPARVLNEATALGHYILHKPDIAGEYLLVMAPSMHDGPDMLACQRQAMLYGLSLLVPRDLLEEMVHDGKDADEIAEFFKLRPADITYMIGLTQAGVDQYMKVLPVDNAEP